MKYIRTKDGKIFDLANRFEAEFNPVHKAMGYIILIDKKKICDYEIYEKDIIKQADTIEELCDAWVITPKGVKCNPFVRNVNENIDHFKNDSHIIYGAIWTDKGLIYVAKMNNEGKLELL